MVIRISFPNIEWNTWKWPNGRLFETLNEIHEMEGCLKAESSIFPGAPWPPTLFQPGLAPKLNKQIPNMYTFPNTKFTFTNTKFTLINTKHKISLHKYQIPNTSIHFDLKNLEIGQCLRDVDIIIYSQWELGWQRLLSNGTDEDAFRNRRPKNKLRPQLCSGTHLGGIFYEKSHSPRWDLLRNHTQLGDAWDAFLDFFGQCLYSQMPRHCPKIIVCQIFSSKPSLPFQPSPQPLAEQEYLGEFSSIMVKKSFPFPFSRAVQPLGNITLIQIQKQQYKSHDCVVGEVKLNSMSRAPEPILIIKKIKIIKIFAIIMIIMISMTNRSSPTLG